MSEAAGVCPATVRPCALRQSMGRLVLLAVLVMLAPREAHADAEPVTLRLGTMAIDGSRYMVDILALSAEIEKKTRGAVRLEWVTNGQLGDEQAMVQLIAKQKLDGGGFSETGLIASVPEMTVWRYPGLFRDYAAVDRATTTLDPAIRELFDKRGLVFAMWADLGFAHVFAAKSIDSLRELLVAASSQLTMPLDAKLFEAVTNGKATAFALPPLFVLALAVKGAPWRTMSKLRYRYVVGGLVISKSAWARVAPKHQAIILDICRVHQPRIRESWRKETERGIASLQKSGVRVQASTDAELTGFFDAAAKDRDAHAAKSGVAELMAKVVAASAPK